MAAWRQGIGAAEAMMTHLALEQDALLYSRTDARGVIESVGAQLAELTGQAPAEMIGEAHNMVRHPDMPAAIFELLWDRLKTGQPFGGYILNAGARGPYWTFAVLTPVEDGFVALRLRPCSGFAERITPYYARLRAREQAGGSVEDRRRMIAAGLRALGFDSYDNFMTYALSREVRARANALGRAPTPGLRRLRRLFDLTRQVEAHATEIRDVFRATAQIPYNMRLQARRLQGNDSAFSVISENHRQMTTGAKAELRRLSDGAQLGSDGVARAAFCVASVGLAHEMAAKLRSGTEVAWPPDGEEAARLDQLMHRYRDHANAAVRQLAGNARGLAQNCRDMRRIVSGLEMTRIMCKIERARVQGDAEGMDEIVTRLVTAEASLRTALGQLDRALREARTLADALLKLNVTAELATNVAA